MYDELMLLTETRTRHRIVLYELFMVNHDRTQRVSMGHYRRYVGAQADGAAMVDPEWHYDIVRVSIARRVR